MNCSESLSLLHLYHRGGLPPDKQVDFGYHWICCPSCRERFETLRIEREHRENQPATLPDSANNPRSARSTLNS